ncbi:MAG: bifunctional pyr operon transcriptional regulator/uracil phosphoribosyltransferase PyrR [Candidatus Lernaella stagnicola]|nr:bifunctional pyr operon transcriptional regulator/uracil phosphoribosyltransferase PyrR [Candidatus Lernaella stagnicola]
MSLVHRRQLMDAKRIDLALKRIAAQIVEHCPDLDKLALIGIRSGGIHPANRIREFLKRSEERDIPVGLVDITLYRDDLADGKAPHFGPTDLEFDIEDAYVVLIDDVLFTGRTLRAAMNVLMEYGRPALIRAAVLIDRREHRELPIQPDYWGQIVDTAREEKINVKVGPKKNRDDGVEVVLLVDPEEGPA